MKTKLSKFGLCFLLTLTVVLVLYLAGCEDEPTKPEPLKPPAIPPLSTFLMDFDDFTPIGQSSYVPNGAVPQDVILSFDNWGWAALNVSIWNIIITVHAAIPVAAFVESFKHQPEQQPDSSWIWSYDFMVHDVEYTAELWGSIDNNGTEWEMYISKEGFYEDFLWYFGEADLFLTEGTWTLNKDPEDPEPIPYIGILWHRDVQDSTADIRYTNIVPDGPENGGYIHYGITNDSPYDAFYDIYNKGQDNLTNIEWNRTVKNGQVKDPAHFEDEDWHCWNENLEDIDCP